MEFMQQLEDEKTFAGKALSNCKHMLDGETLL
jgi:hypothetical protein